MHTFSTNQKEKIPACKTKVNQIKNESTEFSTGTLDRETQTDIYSEEERLQQDKNSKHHTEVKEISNLPQNSFSSTKLEASKTICVIIFNLPEYVNIPDILFSISDSVQISEPNLQFLDKQKLKHSNSYNWIFELPLQTANLLLKQRNYNSR